MTLSKLACSCIAFFALAVTALATTYTTVDYPGADSTIVYGINNEGDMVGVYSVPPGIPHAFMLSAGVFTTIDPPSGIQPVASGINDAKQVVGWYLDESRHAHAFMFDGVTFVAIDYPGSTGTIALGINNDGEIVGAYTDAAGGASPLGFVFENGTYTTLKPPKSRGDVTLTGVNNLGGIVGSALGDLQTFGFKYDNGQFKPIEFPNALETNPNGLNDNGVIVGTYHTKRIVGCFAFVSGQFLRVAWPGPVLTMQCFGINNSGQIVGNWMEYVTGKRHGFVITPGD